MYQLFLRIVDKLPEPGVVAQRRFALAVLLSQALIAVTGSVVRVTGSGLGCPTWPKCSSDSLLPIPHEDIPWWHQAIEFGNRQIAVWIVVTASIAVVLAVTRARRRREVLVYAWIMPLSTFAQGVIGGITVLTGLRWWVVGLHMLLSCVLVWLAATLYAKVTEPDDGYAIKAAPSAARRLVAVSAGVMALALTAGVVVTAAGPHAGDRTNPKAIDRLDVSIPLLTSIHAAMVVLYILIVVAVAVLVARGPSSPAVRRRLKIVFIVVGLQSLIGVVQYFTGVPALLVVLHVAGAMSVIAETAILYRLTSPRVVRGSDRTGDMLPV